jgi:hypothetical protein
MSMLRFEGRIFEDDGFWLAEIPILDAMTQGHTREEAYSMAVDLIETMVDRKGFRVHLFRGEGDSFEIGSSDISDLITLILRQRRVASGLSLAATSSRLEQRSRNAYARYEQGKATPTLTQLARLLEAVDPDHDLVLSLSPR